MSNPKNIKLIRNISLTILVLSLFFCFALITNVKYQVFCKVCLVLFLISLFVFLSYNKKYKIIIEEELRLKVREDDKEKK